MITSLEGVLDVTDIVLGSTPHRLRLPTTIESAIDYDVPIVLDGRLGTVASQVHDWTPESFWITVDWCVWRSTTVGMPGVDDVVMLSGDAFGPTRGSTVHRWVERHGHTRWRETTEHERANYSAAQRQLTKLSQRTWDDVLKAD